MTYYCEKCGHKLGDNKHRCSFCGAFQFWNSDAHYDKKRCKKCGREIYINSNYCPYCGTDQAIISSENYNDLNKDYNNFNHYYCEKCGHGLSKKDNHCGFCGAFQMRLSNNKYDEKRCKKCGRKIYVNSNYCPYCGTDQAILNLDEDIKNNDINNHKSDENMDNINDYDQKFIKKLINLNMIDPKLLENIDRNPNGLTSKLDVTSSKEKNENLNPGLFKSTKLMFRDMFKINKRMGINDYWWGFLGLMLILVIFAFFVPQILLYFHVTMRIVETIIFIVALFFQFILFTATWRRLHDANFSNFWMLLWLIPFGTIILYVMCLNGPNLKDNPYTFNVDDWNKKR